MSSKKLALFTLMALLLATSVLALGISPARTDISYEEGKPKDITLNIINNERKDMRLLVYAEGEHSDKIKIDEKIVNIGRDEQIKQINVRLNMIGEMKKKPGMNEIRLKVLELPESYEGGEETARVGATVELIHQIRINVPYPGIYAEIPDVFITSLEGQDYVLFTLPVYNRGQSNLQGIKGVVKIYDPYGELLGAVDTTSIDLRAGSEGKIEARFYPGGKRGKYKAEISVAYSGKEANIEKEFFIGTEMIKINGVTVDKFKLGGIARFRVILESIWNQKIGDVYADVEIRDSENRQLTKFKTASIDMEADSIGIVDAYWDTADVNPGTYTMHVALYYTRLVTDRWFTMDVGFDSIKIRGDATGAVTAGGDSIAKDPLLLIAVIALMIINITLIVFIYRARRKKIY